MSGEAVPYHLRQNKHVDRLLFIELLSHVNRAVPLKKALYISFGGVYFEDFKLIHQVFGINKMISIEREEWVVQRQLRNRPYGFIKCLYMNSRDFVTSIEDIRRKTGGQLICWLDFTDARTRRGQLEDVHMFAKKARHLDVLRITMNANSSTLAAPKDGETVEQRDQRRRDRLVQEFSDKVSRPIEIDDVSERQFPQFCLEMIRLELRKALVSSPGTVFHPLGSYAYSDSIHRMLTVTGIFLESSQATKFISATGLKRFEFAGLNWELAQINVPLLSHREKLLLDQKFGSRMAGHNVAKSLKFLVNRNPETSREMLKSYFDFHRYYPHYHRIHY